MEMGPNERLAKAISGNNIKDANKAIQDGASMPRATMKHPIFTWLRAMRAENRDALPMLQWLIEHGVDPSFRVKATADRLPRTDFSATLSNRALRQHGDKGDSLLVRLIYSSQFAAAHWLATQVPARDIIHRHSGAAHNLRCPLERVMIVGQWDIVSTMLDRLQDYPIEEDDAEYWLPIHDRALKIQLSDTTPDQDTQKQLDRIFEMGRATGIKLPFLPNHCYSRNISSSSLDAWTRGLPGVDDFLLEDGRRRQRDGWDLLFSSPSSYRDPSGMVHRLLADPRFASVSSRQYRMGIGRESDAQTLGTLCDLAMSGDVDIKSPKDRKIIVDLLRSANCWPSRPRGSAFKQIMAKGKLPGDWLSPNAWRKYEGELPENAIGYCRRASQFKELISWGMDPSIKSPEGVPALVDLFTSMRKRQSSNNLRDLAIEVATFLETHPSLLDLSHPETGETVADLAWIHTSISSRVANIPSHAQVGPWSAVSACVAGQKFDHRLMEWVRQQNGNPVVLPGTDMSPWFASVLRETMVQNKRTSSQKNDTRDGLKLLAPLGGWPMNCAMEGFRRLAAARGEHEDLAVLRSTSFAGYFKPGMLSQSIQSSDDVALLAHTAVAERGEMLKLLRAEICHMDTSSRVDLLCSWSSSAMTAIEKSSEEEDSYQMEMSAVMPHDTTIELLDFIVQDVDIDDEKLSRVVNGGNMITQMEQQAVSPDEKFLADLNLRLAHLSMHRNTQKATAASRPPGKRF